MVKIFNKIMLSFFLIGMLISGQIFAQQRTVKGKITSAEDQSAIVGASIRAVGSNVGTTTDANGNFTLSLPAKAKIIISSIGFGSREVAVGNQTNINLSLSAESTAIEEVVVVGYGTQKKASLTGAVSSVTAKEITDVPVVSVESALQGRVSGIQVTNNGSPGVAPVVRVRGIGSINYASNPLYVVDGYPVGGLNEINNADIESIDVLKDASSAAIYGSRAANGVILVTTKKGKKDGKLRVNVDSFYGVQNAWKKLDVLNRDQYLQYGKTMLTAAGSAFPDRWAVLNNETYKGSGVTFAQTDVDLHDYLFRTGPMQQHVVSLSSGTDKSRFYTSLSYFKQDGIYVGTNFERGTLRLNSDHDISKVFSFGQTLTIARSFKLDENAGGGRTALANIVKGVPYIPVYNPTEIGGFYGTTNADGSDPVNPLIPALLTRSQNKNLRIFATGFITAKITDWLKYRFTAGADLNTNNYFSRTPIFTSGQSGSPTNQLSSNRGEYIGKLFTNQLTFDKTFGKHYVNIIGVAEQQFGQSAQISALGNYTTNNFTVVTSNILKQAVSGYKDESALLSYLGRINYDYAGKYLLSASIRRDGSSLFAPGKKYGTFPAASVGWRISEENFMKGLPAISEMKIRGSFGLVGNVSGIPNYAWQSTIGASSNTVFINGLNPGQSINQLGNADLGWELTKMTNFGIDVGFLNNKFNLSADYYVRETADNSLILERGLPSSLGYSNATIANFGSMKNTGLDLQLEYNNYAGGFKYSITGNASTIQNKITSLEAPLYRGTHGETGSTVTKTEVGETVQYLYGFLIDKIYQNKGEIDADQAVATGKGHDSYQGGKAEPGDYRFKDLNGDGKVDDADRTKIGNVLPKLIYGLNFNGSYKNLDFTIFGQGVYGNDLYNNLKYATQGMTRLFGSTTDVLRAWTPSNTNTDVPRAVSGDPNQNAVKPSNRFVEKGSFARLKNLSVGYTLSGNTLSNLTKGNLNSARIYVSSQNLLTITKYTGYDPEIGSRDGGQLNYGIDDGQYPQPKTFLVGIQLGF